MSNPHDAGLTAQLARQRRVIDVLLRAGGVGPFPGVYLLLSKADECLYVGQSANVARRLAEHRLVEYQRPLMLPCADADARAEIERLLIDVLQPRLNTQGRLL